MADATIQIHVVPGADATAAARDLLEAGAVGIDDIGEHSHADIEGEILDELGHAGDALDLQYERVDTALGPVFVVRNSAEWSAREASAAVLASRGQP